MKAFLLCLAALPLAAQAQLAVTGGSLTVLPGTTLSVAADVSVSAGATLDNQGTVPLAGNLTSAGTLASTGGTGQWQLAGTSVAQQVAISSLLPYLDVQNPQGATLGANLRVRQLLLSGGPVRLGAFTLTSTLGGSIAGVSAAAGRFVVTDGSGALQQYVGSAGVLFPVGPTAARYAPATLARSTGSDLYQVAAGPAALTQGSAGPAYTSHAVALRWQVTAPDATPYDFTAQWAGSDELPSFNRALSALARYNGSAYVPTAYGPATGTNPYQRSSAGLTDGGTFAVLDQAAPLPVELTAFEARRPAGQPRVELTWTTASEHDNVGFEVQRQDAGQATFHRVGFVPGRGTSLVPSRYAFSDPNTFDGLSYYRLRQVDFDGTEIYSPVRVVAGLPTGTAFSLSAYPNPARTTVALDATGPVPPGLTLTLLAVDGRVVWQRSQAELALTAPIDVRALAAGTYLLRYQAADGTHGTLPLLVAH